MTPVLRNVAVLTVLAVGLVAALAERTFSQQTPTRIGTVDLSRVFDEYVKRKQIEEDLNAQTTALEKSFTEQKAAIEQARGDLASLNPTSDKYRDEERRLALQSFGLKYDRDRALQQLETDARRKKALLYREIVDEVSAYGEGNGFVAILLSVPVDEELADRPDMNLLTSTRTVLWRHDSVDVTAEIVKLLNAGR